MAQTNRLIQEGNKLYEEQRYKDAAANYQKALAKDPNNYSGAFNLSNSLYQQKQYDSSRKFLTSTEKNMKDKNAKSAMNYNIGNSYMAQQKYEDAVKSYKQTLRNNPNDVDAKYNLSYAEQMLKKQQQQNKDQKQNQDKQQQQKQKQDQQKQDQKKNEKNDQKQPKPDDNKDKKDEQQQPQGGQAGNLSQQQADQLLNALQQQEKKLQDKLKKEKGANTRLEKDW
jgi:tetratricopeptide (TPR) repeat protein